MLVSNKLESIVEAVPYITFLYLFQPNVPQTFDELSPDPDSVEAQETPLRQVSEFDTNQSESID